MLIGMRKLSPAHKKVFSCLYDNFPVPTPKRSPWHKKNINSGFTNYTLPDIHHKPVRYRFRYWRISAGYAPVRRAWHGVLYEESGKTCFARNNNIPVFWPQSPFDNSSRQTYGWSPIRTQPSGRLWNTDNFHHPAKHYSGLWQARNTCSPESEGQLDDGGIYQPLYTARKSNEKNRKGRIRN